MSILALDVGGTTTRFQIDDGETEKRRTTPAGLLALIQEILAENGGIDKVGISFAGQVCDGKILSAPNIQLGELEGMDVPSAFKERFGVAGAIENDLKCAALAEAKARPEVQSLVAFFPGTGVGGAMVENGQLIRGKRNLAGEVGHIPFMDAPFTCGCGNSNCLELFASGSGLKKWLDYYHYQERHLGEVIDTLKFGKIDKKKKERLDVIFQQFVDGIFHGVSTLNTLLNPEVIVLGGGISAKHPFLIEYVKSRMAEEGFPPARDVAIEASAYGEAAPITGAGLLFDQTKELS